jgi:hypothetical protein
MTEAAVAAATYAPALIGILGVMVGGAITAGANYALAVRKERADRIRDAANSEREVQRAARLVSLELAQAKSQWSLAIQYDVRFDAEEIIKIEAWDAHKAILAEHLPLKDWNALAEGFQTISEWSHLISTNNRSSKVFGRDMRLMYLRIVVACDAAQQYAGGTVI